EAAADKRSFTLGVEGISARMRAYYRKGLTDAELETAIGRILASGARELKLSYILAGIEEDSDLAEFEAFAERLAARRTAAAPGLRVLVSSGYLVRLPFTPLQYAPLALDMAQLGRISRRVEAACARARIEYRLAVHPDEYCADQVLALGGPSLSAWLAGAPSRGHAYDGALSRGAWASLSAFAKSAGVINASFLAEKGADWLPPLSFCDEDHAVLRRNYEAARARTDRPPCLGADCSGCGACADGDEREALSSHRIAPAPPGFADRLGRLLAAKASFPTLAVAADLPEGLFGATDEYRSSWLLRSLSRAARGSEAAVFEAREALFSSGPFEGALPSFCGRCAFALRGPDAARLAAVARAAGLEPLEALPEAHAADIEILIPPPYAERAIAAFTDHLTERHFGFSESRIDGADARSRVFAISPRDASRKTILSARLVYGEDGSLRAFVSIGRKARIGDWLETCGPGAVRSAVIRVLGYRA
ncbi:MAG: hypothetical protein Q8M76_03485, partial [Spirochaetaceae bacterium]|nr:hypothetical protein [Spirochaetaceae bacterium]